MYRYCEQIAEYTRIFVRWYLGVDLASLTESMSYQPLTVAEQAKDLPLKWFEAHPVTGNKILTFHIQVQDDKTFGLLITGNTWLYRDDLERHGISGSREGERYIRYLQNVDCTNDEMKQQVLSLVDIFRKQNIRVVVEPTAAELGSTVAAFLDDEMSTLPQFHFAS